MQYEDSESSGTSSSGGTPLLSGERSTPAFQQSAARQQGQLPASSAAQAPVSAVRTSVPPQVAADLRTRLAVHSDVSESDEEKEPSSLPGGVAPPSHGRPDQPKASAADAHDTTGFNSTVFMMRPSAAVVRKFNVLDSGDDDYGTSELSDHAHPTPSRNKGLRDGQNVSVGADESDDDSSSVSSSRAGTDRSAPQPPLPAKASTAPAASTTVIRRMPLPTPSLSSSSSSEVNAVDTGNGQAAHSAGDAAAETSSGIAITTTLDGTDTVSSERHVAPPQVVHDDSSGPLGSPAVTVGTVERLCPSPPSSSASSDTATEFVVTPPPVSSDLGVTEVGSTTKTPETTEAPRRPSGAAGRMLPPPSTDSTSSTSSGSSSVVMIRAPPPPGLTAPRFHDDTPAQAQAEDENDREDWEDVGPTQPRTHLHQPPPPGATEPEDDDEADNDDEQVVFHDADAAIATDPLDRDFPIQEWEADMFTDMLLIDSTPFTAMYQCDEVVPEEDNVVLENNVKLMDPFAGVWGEPMVASTHVSDAASAEAPRVVRAAQREQLNAAQQQLQRAASWMMTLQTQLADTGLTAPCGPDGAACCRGVANIGVDTRARLLGEIEVEPCTLPLSTVIAFLGAPPEQRDIVALLGSIAVKLALLHERGLVHGALHAGNVLCSTDDGHTVLSQPCGILAQLALPADASFFTPRQAARLWPLVSDLWSVTTDDSSVPVAASPSGRLGTASQGLDTQEKVRLHTQRWFAASEEASAAADTSSDDPVERGLVLPWIGCVTPGDDVYAVGLLLLGMLTGVPAFHAVAVCDVMATLAALATEAAASISTRGALRDWVKRTLVQPALSSNTLVSRSKLADYDVDFLSLCELFIVDCLCAGFDLPADATGERPYATAVKLLQHPFFQQYLPDYAIGPEAMAADQDALATVAEQLDCVHRLVYPVYSLACSVQSRCGSTPYLLRAQRNAIFSARRQALSSTADARGTSSCLSAVGALWPSLESGVARGWGTAHPSITSCQRGSGGDAARPEKTSTPLSCALYFPPTHVQQPHTSEVALRSQKETLESTKDCQVLLNLHTILCENLDGAAIRMDRDDMAPLRHAVDKLVLRNLTRCRIEIMTYFRYIVLDDLTDCDVVLGPCFACHMHKVHLCGNLAVACTYMVLDDVSDCGLQFAGLQSPTAKEGTVRDVRLQPYSVCYCGLSEDYAAVGLPAEHVLTLPFFDASVRHPVRRELRYLGAGATTAQDFPYSIPLVATGNSFCHQNDNESDVYVLYKELSGKDVLIRHIEGSSSEPSTGTVLTMLAALELWQREENTDGAPHKLPQPVTDKGASNRQPVIFILDAVGDVKIEHCSHCTVFVVGSCGSAEVRHCHDMQLFLMARECVIDSCANVHVFAMVTEFLALVACHELVLDPLILQCPYFDAIFNAMITAGANVSEEDVEVQEFIQAAYEAADMEALNVVLQGNGRSIEMSACGAVEVHDLEWLAVNPSTALMMVSVPVPALELAQSEDEQEEEADARTHGRDTPSSPSITACEFFTRYCHRHRTTPQSFFTHKSFLELVTETANKGGAALSPTTSARPLVRFHNLLAASVLRVRHGLLLRQRSHTTDQGATGLPDVVLEQVHLGEIHIGEPVGNVLIRHCTGPLDIVVCAAQHVLLDGCANVTVRVACRALAAQDCQHCHIAAHVNSRPRYLRCAAMLTSVLNMTTEDMEGVMAESAVDIAVNRFDDPYVLPSATESVLALPVSFTSPAASTPAEDVPVLHRCCTETQVDLTLGMTDAALVVSSMETCLGLLCRPVTAGPPLPGLCVGVMESEFLEPLEARVSAEEAHRIPFDSVLMAALAFLTADGVDLAGLDAGTVTPQAEIATPPKQNETTTVVEDKQDVRVPLPQTESAAAEADESADSEPADEVEVGEVEEPPAAHPDPEEDQHAQHTSARDRYETCDSASSSSGQAVDEKDEQAAAAFQRLRECHSSPQADAHLLHASPLTTSGDAVNEAGDTFTPGAVCSPSLGDAALPVQAHHVDPAMGSPDARADTSLQYVRVPATTEAHRYGLETSPCAFEARLLPHGGSTSPSCDEQSLCMDGPLNAPKSSVPTTGLSMASPLSILRAPAQAPLNAQTAQFGHGVPPMGSLEVEMAMPASTSSSVSSSVPQPGDGVRGGSQESVNLGDTAREMSFSSAVQTYQQVRREHVPGEEDREDPMPRAPKPAAFLNFDDSRDEGDEDADADAYSREPPFWSYTPPIEIGYLQDEGEGHRLLSDVRMDKSTREALLEAMEDARLARQEYEELLTEMPATTFEYRVERAMKLLGAQSGRDTERA